MIKINPIKLSLAVCISVGYMNSALADFNIYADPEVVSERIVKQDRHSFKQIGGSLEKSKVVKNGYAPLNIALKHLVPEGWDIKIAENIGLENSIVKWKGNVTWPYALENISLNNDMDIVVNWERRYVSIDSNVKREDLIVKEMEKFKEDHKVNAENLPLLAKDESIKPINNSSSLLNKEEKIEEKESSTIDLIPEDAVVSTEQKIQQMSPKEKFELTETFNSINVLPVEKTFEAFVENKDVPKHEYMQLRFILKAGKSVQENLREWASYMPKNPIAWTLEWNAEKDFLVTKDIELVSTFIDVFPMVEKLYENSKDPFKINLYIKNNTIVVFNKEYKINHKGAGL